MYRSSTAIQQLIDDQSWSILARRLCADKALVPFAFLCCERETETEFIRCIEDLLTKHFVDILEDAPGFIRTSIPKGMRALARTAASAEEPDESVPKSETPSQSF